MTLEEAQKIADICSTVDGGCPVCVEISCIKLSEAFPEFYWEYDDDIIVSEKQ